MPDPFRQVTPGDPFEFPAVVYNAMLDTIRDAGYATGAGDPGRASGRQPAIIRVKNESGSDILRNQVLGLDGPIFTPTDSEDAFLRSVSFRGVVPLDSLHRRRYCVLIDPAADGMFARAWVAGVCQVKVDVKDASHEFAKIVDGDPTMLESDHHGSAQILWTETDDTYYGSETGVMWAIVRLGSSGEGLFRAAVTTAIPTGSIGSPSSSGRAVVYIDGVADSTSVTVWNDHTLSSPIDTGKVVKLGVIDGKYWLLAADC